MLKYDEFIERVNEAGFFTPFTNYIGSDVDGQDYTCDPDTDPRKWRTRATQEKKLACGYYFNGKPGYIAPHYFTIFIDAFRPHLTIEERYLTGKLSRYERDIWNLFNTTNDTPLSWADIWQKLNVKDKVERRKLEAALIQLQMMFDVTINGDIDGVSKKGEVYTQFLGYIKVDSWAPAEWMKMNPRMEHKEALEIIYRQAERISNTGHTQKAFMKSLTLYRSFL